MLPVEPWVLLVEDNPDDRDLAIHALSRGGVRHRVDVTQNGVEALDLLFCRGAWAHRDIDDLPNVVLLDLKLPLVDGLEVLRELKGDERLRTIPVVVMTSSAEDRDLAASYSLGANSYVVKPVDIDRFFTVVLDVGMYWLGINRPTRGSVA